MLRGMLQSTRNRLQSGTGLWHIHQRRERALRFSDRPVVKYLFRRRMQLQSRGRPRGPTSAFQQDASRTTRQRARQHDVPFTTGAAKATSRRNRTPGRQAGRSAIKVRAEPRRATRKSRIRLFHVRNRVGPR